MSPAAEKALAVLKVSEGNILSQWHAEGREVFEPFGPWLASVRESIADLEAENKSHE